LQTLRGEFVVDIYSPWLGLGPLIYLGKAPKSQRSQQQSEITQSDVIEAWIAQEIDDDSNEP
jgi:hypothetical protein